MNSWRPEMVSDTITDEIRGVRRELAAQFGNNLDLILADIRSRETLDGRVYITLPPRVIPRQSDEPGVDRKSPSQSDLENDQTRRLR